MATCSKCGAQLEGNERFCVKCGNDLTAHANGPAAVAATPVTAAAPPVTPSIAPPPHFAGPGSVPVVAMPPAAPAKSHTLAWIVIGLVILLGGYYYYTHHSQTASAGATPGQAGSAPGQTGSGQGGVQGQPTTPVAGQPADSPGEVPQQGLEPGQVQQGQNVDLVNLQALAWHGVPLNGFVEISTAMWTNRSNVVMQSATMKCIQLAGNGAIITQSQTILNGPVRPGTTSYFRPFTMGLIAPAMAKVECGIVAVTPAN
jgi:hypothetical protein